MPDFQPLPFNASLAQYMTQAEALLNVFQSEGLPRVEQFRQEQLSFRIWPAPKSEKTEFTVTDAWQLIAQRYGFSSWEELTSYVHEATQEGSAVWQFEVAVDAIIGGDVATLASVLQANPTLIQLRSRRVHQAMLLHYIAANGVENYRQQSPPNAVAIAEVLLKAGADIDALADIYGKVTTLGLVATSVHPQRAGVQVPLINTLLAYGASVNGTPETEPPLLAALANGFPEAARSIALHGARIDTLVAAAGLGRLDWVRDFFDADGRQKPADPAKANRNVASDQLTRAFIYACRYNHLAVAEFLLQQGIDPNSQDENGQTGLHWAVLGGQLDLVKWLLKQAVSLDRRNVYGGTALGQALWSVSNGNPDIDYIPIIEALLDAGAVVDAGTQAWLKQQMLPPATEKRLNDLLQRATS